jgi:cellulase/cellobiase CelA1
MSRKQKRMQNLREAKDRRMKKIAIGGAVLLVAVLAFEVGPKILGGKSSSTSSPAPAATTTDASAAPATTPPTTPPGTAAAVTPAASTKLTNSDVEPKLEKSQLYSFTHFAGKDPFVQQVNTAVQPAGGSSGSSGSSSSQKPPVSANGTTAAVSHHAPSRVLTASNAARIAINGRVQVVRIGATFPSSNPLFRLIALTNGVARIAIANGSYSSGARTVSLAAGRPLTLVDTADGTRYQIRLVS